MGQIGNRRSSEKDDSTDNIDVPELNHSNRSSDTSMDLDTTICPPDMDTTTRNIEYLKISGEIADDAEHFADDAGIVTTNAENLETSLGSFIPPPGSPSDRTSNCSTDAYRSNYVSDGPLSESETSAFNDSFHSCDSKIGDSTSELELIVTGASPPREDSGMLEPVEIPRTTSFFNKMMDPQGNLRTFSPEEDSKKIQRRAR